MKYANAQAFRQALGDRLTSQARAEGLDLSRLQRRVAFERFLARVHRRAGEGLLLKGDYALELRLGGKARATVDLDFAAAVQDREELLERLQEAAELDLGDFFRYTVAPPGHPNWSARPRAGSASGSRPGWTGPAPSPPSCWTWGWAMPKFIRRSTWRPAST